ncbi:MAG: aminoacyl-tRNA hydrolase [Lachnospiraceae bacterium]|nr:aminoacyl-tRNA hydrolase [Lachnospiraceae bacterium]
MYIIAGLGNPGKKYENTRHNAGFDVLDVLAEKYGINISEKKHKAIIGKGIIDGCKVILVKPQTFMNLSGESIREIVDYYDVDPEEELVVISDDITLAPGNLRIRAKGSAGGHNGLKNIIAQLGTDAFKRVRVGVGEKEEGSDLVNHVLGHMSKEERDDFSKAAVDAADAAVLCMKGEVAEAMNRYNGKRV